MTNDSAEREVLRAALANTDVIGEVAEIISARDFYSAQGRVIWETIMEAWANSKPIDPPILASELERKGLLETAGGMTYVMDLALGNPSQAGYFAKRLRDQAELRRMASIGTELKQRAETGTEPDELREWLDEATAHISDTATNKVVSVSEDIDTLLDGIMSEDRTPVFPTGYAELDERLSGGFRGGDSIIVAARPGAGKSLVVSNILCNGAIRHGKNVLFISLEMSREEVLTRIMSSEFTIQPSAFKKRTVPQEKLNEIKETLKEIPGLFIDDSPNMTMTDVRAKARQLHKNNPLDLICIDYIGLLEPTDPKAPRQEQVSRISRQVKLLAKELNIPVIAVSQLNRGVEQRDNPIPKASDLRESGSLEQDASQVVLVHRPDATDPDDARAGEVDLLLVKNRGGTIGTVTLASQPHYCRFVDPPRFDTAPVHEVEWSPTGSIEQ